MNVISRKILDLYRHARAGISHGKPLLGNLALSSLVLLAGETVAQQIKVPDTTAQRAAACAACHGKEGQATREGFFPRIAGKPADYLYNQLLNFREGRRQYAPMTYMVAHMSNDYLRELSRYFSSLDLPYPPGQAMNAPPATLERGRTLVLHGDVGRNIPACITCHGEKLTGRLPAIPSLVGLPRDYLNAQFGAWKNGARRAAAPDCMAEISRQLSPEDIGAVSTWLAAQPVPPDMHPMPAATEKLPLPCGSVAQ
jgi:cytochrome c553